jgi:Mg2+ and Co2+ transporter CorA
VDARLASLAAATTRIADALRRLHDGNQETLEIVRQLSSLLAGFPELSADAARLLGDVEERLDSIERRTADGADILGRAARDAAEAKENTAGVKQSQEQCRRACEELLQEQGQIAEVFSGLRELTSRSVDLARASAAAIKTIADERAERVDDLREHVSEECRRVATRATVASLLAALGAVAAATAAVISALHQP